MANVGIRSLGHNAEQVNMCVDGRVSWRKSTELGNDLFHEGVPSGMNCKLLGMFLLIGTLSDKQERVTEMQNFVLTGGGFLPPFCHLAQQAKE